VEGELMYHCYIKIFYPTDKKCAKFHHVDNFEDKMIINSKGYGSLDIFEVGKDYTKEELDKLKEK
jgi:hypothetical protein